MDRVRGTARRLRPILDRVEVSLRLVVNPSYAGRTYVIFFVDKAIDPIDPRA